MACCTLEGTDKLFSSQADRYARKFRKKGLDRAQRAIMRVLEQRGLRGRSVLEVGCGVGGLILSLLRKGGSSGVGFEISQGMIAKAKELARESGVSERVTYVQGDFVSHGVDVPMADIVVLDKVLCCYPDPDVLIERSSAKAAIFYAVSYPRDAVMARSYFTATERLGTMLKWSFHPFYHKPRDLDELIFRQGWEEMDAETTPMRQVKVFRRRNGRGRTSQ